MLYIFINYKHAVYNCFYTESNLNTVRIDILIVIINVQETSVIQTRVVFGYKKSLQSVRCFSWTSIEIAAKSNI